MVVDVKTNQISQTLPIGYTPQTMVISGNNKKLFVGCSVPDNVIVIMNVRKSGALSISSVLPFQSPIGMAASSDGKYIYVSSGNSPGGFVARIKTKTGAVDKTASIGPSLDVALSPDNKFVYATSNAGNTFKMNARLKVLKTFITPNPSIAIGVSSNGKKIYVATHSQILVLNSKTGSQKASIAFGSAFQTPVTCSPSVDNTYLFFPLPGGTQMAKISSNSGKMTVLTFPRLGVQIGASTGKKIIAIPVMSTGPGVPDTLQIQRV